MNHIYKVLSTWAALSAVIAILFLNACSEDDPPLPDNLVQFDATEAGISDNESELPVTVQFSRAIDQSVTLEFEITSSGLVYGTDFTTEPAAAANKVSLSVPAGSTSTAVLLKKEAGVLFDGDESVTFTLLSTGESLVAGEKTEMVVSFSEILSPGATLDINGGGAAYTNKVFIDLSANRQTAVDRNSWDVGFHSGDDFRVVLNSSVNMLVRPLDKTDLNAVVPADTVGFKSAMTVGFTSTHDALPWIDAPSGDITQTAIAQVSPTASENKVYIINRGSAAKNWKKIRIIRNGEGYTIQHADIAATSFSEINITKSDTHLFSYLHFENGEVSVEPAKEKWEIAWTYFVNKTGAPGDEIPYGFQDIILQNRNGVEVAKVLTSAVAYDDFSENHIAAQTFTSSSQLSIGSDWRATQPAAAVNTDRFYIVRDADGNYYKLKFTAILKDGVRGTPQIQFALVKEGE